MAQEDSKVIKPGQLTFKFQELGNDWFIPEDDGAAVLKQGTLVSVWGTAPVSKGRYRVCFRLARARSAFGWDDNTPLTVGVQIRGQGDKATTKRVKVNQELSPSYWKKINIEEDVPGGVNEIKLFLLETTQVQMKVGLFIHSVTVEKIGQ